MTLMGTFMREHAYDFLFLVLGVGSVVLYQVYLRWRIRRDPASSARHGMNAEPMG